MTAVRLRAPGDDEDAPRSARPKSPSHRAYPGRKRLTESDYMEALKMLLGAGKSLHDAEERSRDLTVRYRDVLQAANEKLRAAQELVRSAEDRALRAEALQRDAEERAARAEAHARAADARVKEAEEGAVSDREGLALIRKAFERFRVAHGQLGFDPEDFE